MKLSRVLLAPPILLNLSACALLFPDHSSPPVQLRSEIPDSEQIVFEIAYFNMAWGVQQKGTYIDALGNVYSYDRTKEIYERNREIWEPQNENCYKHEELLEKFTNPKLIGRVETDTLLEMRSLIATAAQEELVEHDCCRDAGELLYLAYAYCGRNGYRPVRLYQSGDLSGENPSEAAKELTRWIHSATGGKGDPYSEDNVCHCMEDY